MGPGSAAHHFMLRCVPGTSNAYFRCLAMGTRQSQQRVILHRLDRREIAVRDIFRPRRGADVVRNRIQRQ
jgi:hypothetical protein